MLFTAFFLLAVPALGAIHHVDVGESGLSFSPQTLTPKVGDVIVFELYNGHDVAQSTFDKPCNPSSGGFYSGPYSNTDGGKKKFVYNVTTTDPIYFYCAVPTHCQSGMVGGFNIPSSGNTISAYADAAKKAQTVRPQGISGGRLEDDQQLASLTGSGVMSTPTASNTGPPSTSVSQTSSGGATTPTSTNVADIVGTPATGLLAGVLGFAAWLL